MRPSWSCLIQNDSIVTGGLLCFPQEVSSIVWSSNSITTYSDQMVALISYQQKAVFGQSWLRAGPFLFLFKPLSHHITLACSRVGRGVPILSRVTAMFSWGGYFSPASDISVNLKTKGNKNTVTETAPPGVRILSFHFTLPAGLTEGLAVFKHFLISQSSPALPKPPLPIFLDAVSFPKIRKQQTFFSTHISSLNSDSSFLGITDSMVPCLRYRSSPTHGHWCTSLCEH